MPAAPPALALAADFDRPTHEQWRGLLAAVLAKQGGAVEDPVRTLTRTTYDGIAIAPLYTRAHDAAGDPTGNPGCAAASAPAPTPDWDIRTRHAGPDPRATNTAILEDLERGATSIWLVCGPAALPVDSLGSTLRGVYLDLAPVVLDAGSATPGAAAALLTLAGDNGVDPTAVSGSLGADPIGLQARTGRPAQLSTLAALAGHRVDFSALTLSTVDATVYHDAGASDAQELGIAAAVAVTYLRTLTDAGCSLADALAAIEFRFAVTADQFASTAKLRAARVVWARVAQLCGVPDGAGIAQRQHAVTSAAMMTRRDPWVNMLRTTIACVAAAVGGADSITVAPFDSAIGISDAFARRVARNTHAVLHDEAGLARVADPAAGSWYVEDVTEALALRAWDVFTGIERAGGAAAALDAGGIEALIAPVRAARTADIAHRRAPITGVSEFAFVAEVPVVRPAKPDPADTDSESDSVATQLIASLRTIRYAEEFEALRDRADAHAAATGARPAVLLAALGPAAAHSARLGFAGNLFNAGGFATWPAVGDAGAIAAQLHASGATLACLCGSDAGYTELGPDTMAALRAAGATQVWIAGSALDGVDGRVFAGCDAVAVLGAALDAAGVDA